MDATEYIALSSATQGIVPLVVGSVAIGLFLVVFGIGLVSFRKHRHVQQRVSLIYLGVGLLLVLIVLALY